MLHFTAFKFKNILWQNITKQKTDNTGGNISHIIDKGFKKSHHSMKVGEAVFQ